MNEEIVQSLIDQLVNNVGPDACLRCEERARATILNTSASEILTFVTPYGTRIEPTASIEYVKALFAFVRGKPHEGEELDSAITQPIVEATQAALIESLNSDLVQAAIRRSIAPEHTVGTEIRATVDKEAKWIINEAVSASGIHPLGPLGDQVSAFASERAAEILHSALGKTVIAAFAKIAVTAQGKVIIARLITTGAAKVAASTALKSVVLAAVKKVGVAVLVKALVVKILATLLPAVIAAKIPVFWIVLPLIAAFIVHDMKKMPTKLAEVIPGKIAAQIRTAFPEIARDFAHLVLGEAIRTVCAEMNP